MQRKKKMLFWSLLGIVLVAAAIIASYIFLFQRPNPALASDQVRINSAVFKVEIASTTVEEARGLSFRPSLGADQGMLFLFSTPSVQSFWMKDMNFP